MRPCRMSSTSCKFALVSCGTSFFSLPPFFDDTKLSALSVFLQQQISAVQLSILYSCVTKGTWCWLFKKVNQISKFLFVNVIYLFIYLFIIFKAAVCQEIMLLKKLLSCLWKVQFMEILNVVESLIFWLHIWIVQLSLTRKRFLFLNHELLRFPDRDL